MTIEFERFVQTCKLWPTSEPVRERGELVPTYLFLTQSGELRYGDFWVAETPESVLGACADLVWELGVVKPVAFAVIARLDTAEVLAENGERVNSALMALRDYRNAVLLCTFGKHQERSLIGVTNDFESGIDEWHEMSGADGQLGETLTRIAANWRAGRDFASAAQLCALDEPTTRRLGELAATQATASRRVILVERLTRISLALAEASTDEELTAVIAASASYVAAGDPAWLAATRSSRSESEKAAAFAITHAAQRRLEDAGYATYTLRSPRHGIVTFFAPDPLTPELQHDLDEELAILG